MLIPLRLAPEPNRNGISLSGVIDNFVTGETARPDWSVKLIADADQYSGVDVDGHR